MNEYIIVYLVVSLIITIATAVKFPPKSGRQRDAGEWFIVVGLCWFLAPFCIPDWIKYYRTGSAYPASEEEK